MASLITRTLDAYDSLLNEYSDHRVKNWTLMDSPFPTLWLLIFYQYFVRSLGPRLMKDREPFKLDKVMIIYNLVQVLVNMWFVEESFRHIWLKGRYSVICEEVDYSDDPIAILVANFSWCFYLTKILDLLDTVFMVLRKKMMQVSFLHVYHHTGMVLATWIATKYVAGGHGVMFGTINAFVHMVMYSYYLLTTLYPEYKKSIWWKKHITELQLIQFVLTTLHCSVALFNPYCKFPKLLLAAFIPQDIFMFFLFLDFYRKEYLHPKGKQTVKKHVD
ncbi:very long chain fatty acid elongase AAEL008004-like [Lycorma delicatula]|uniref:very long chain fatty acid elongase AAEL008004-like n=1 Tax=Lycorma delicatula TaxID=130591 RepID=UPI003F5108B4